MKPSQASYRLRTLRTHGLVEPVGGRRRYQLTRPGRPIVVFLVKLYRHVLAPVVQAAVDGVQGFRSTLAEDPIDDALHALLLTLGIARPRPLQA